MVTKKIRPDNHMVFKSFKSRREVSKCKSRGSKSSFWLNKFFDSACTLVYRLLSSCPFVFQLTSLNINQSNLSNHNSREEEKQVSQGGIERLKILTLDL